MAHENFYAVCATVIPVLMLTGSLQAALWRRYVREMSEPLRPGRQHRHHARRWPRWVASSVAVVTLSIGGLGEWIAIDALAGNQDTVGNRDSVRTAVLVLFGIVALAVIREVLAEINRKAPESDA